MKDDAGRLIRVIPNSLYRSPSSLGTQRIRRSRSGIITSLKSGVQPIGNRIAKELVLKNRATPAPAASCQIAAIAGVFEAAAT